MKKIFKNLFKRKNKDILAELEFSEEEILSELHMLDYMSIWRVDDPINNEIYSICHHTDGKYSIIYEIIPTDLESLSDTDRKKIVNDYFKSLKMFENKFKIISLNKKYDLTNVINYHKKKLLNFEKNSVAYIEKMREIEKLLVLENNQQLKFYVITYIDNYDSIDVVNKNFESNFMSGKLKIKHLKKQEVLEVLQKINNQGFKK